jgi:iron-sulfur cluster assembly protein
MTIKKKMQKQILTISDRAALQIQHLMKEKIDVILGIRVTIKSGGCAGFKYIIEYADKINPYEEIISQKGVKLFIDPKAIMYLIGSEMDYVSEKFKSGFVFVNPNEKESCGCGKSFNV